MEKRRRAVKGSFREKTGRKRALPIRGRYHIRGQKNRNFKVIKRDIDNYGQYEKNTENTFSYEKLKEINNKDQKEIIEYFINFNNLLQIFENTNFDNNIIDL